MLILQHTSQWAMLRLNLERCHEYINPWNVRINTIRMCQTNDQRVILGYRLMSLFAKEAGAFYGSLLILDHLLIKIELQISVVLFSQSDLLTSAKGVVFQALLNENIMVSHDFFNWVRITGDATQWFRNRSILKKIFRSKNFFDVFAIFFLLEVCSNFKKVKFSRIFASIF